MHAPLQKSPLRFATATALSLGLLSACATNPVSGKKEVSLMSESQEISIGKQYDAEVQKEMGIYDDRALQEYVEGIGMKLAKASERPNLPWHFTLVDVPAVNAFALPGGYIYLTRGILAYLDDEAELAGVLGHEIGHVTARHAAQAYTKSTSASIGLVVASIFFPQTRPFGQIAETSLGLLFLKHSRENELQSDALGARYAASTGWDPQGVPDLLSTLGRIRETSDRSGVPNWLETHPQPADRVTKIQQTVAQLGASDRRFAVNRDDFLRRVKGVVFGDNPEEGIVRGNAFLHPVLRFGVEFPQGWEISNGKTQVLAKRPGEDVFMLLQLVNEPQGRNVEEIALGSMQKAGFRRVDGGTTTINGLRAYQGTYQGSMEGLGNVVTRATHIVQDQSVYIFAGIAQPKLFDSVSRDFDTSLRTFRELSRSEAANVKPNRIDLYTVRAGDTWQSIAQRTADGTVKATTLAIMNNSAVTQQPQAGRVIKVVAAG